MALLRTVATGWREEQVIANAQDIAETSRELFNRVTVFANHVSKLRDGLSDAVDAYSKACRSWEARVLPQARRVMELGGGIREGEPIQLAPIDTLVPELPSAAEGTPDQSGAVMFVQFRAESSSEIFQSRVLLAK